MDTELSKVGLSAKGLGNVFSSCSDENFTFAVGRERYVVPKSLAQYISPTISQIQRSDATFNELVVDENDDEGQKFGLIMNLAKGQRIELSPVDALSLTGYAEKLGNSELFGKFSKIANVKMDSSTAIDILRSKIKWGMDREIEREFVASHLLEYGVRDLLRIPLDELEIIFSSKHLRIETESHLFALVQELVDEGGEDYEILYENVLFDYLDEEDMVKFVELIPITHVSGTLWEAIGRRLVLKVAPKTFDAARFAKGTVPFTNDPFDGIAAYLRRESGKNPVSIGVIDVECLSGNPYPEKLFDPNWKCYWSTKDAPGQWIAFKFPKHLVHLTEYTLKSANSKKGWNHLKSWVIEGSNDGENWTEIDRREDNNDLNGKGNVMTWRCENPMRARIIRLRQIGKNHRGTDDLQLNAIEFFGQLTERENSECWINTDPVREAVVIGA
jgi:hypothetical protein